MQISLLVLAYNGSGFRVQGSGLNIGEERPTFYPPSFWQTVPAGGRRAQRPALHGFVFIVLVLENQNFGKFEAKYPEDEDEDDLNESESPDSKPATRSSQQKNKNKDYKKSSK